MRLNGSKFDRLISWAIITKSDDFFNWDRSHIHFNYKLRRQFRSRNNSNFKNLRSDPIFCPLWMFLLLLFLITVLFFEAITGFNNVGTIRRLSLEAKTMSHVSWSNYTEGKKIEYFCKKSPGSGITMFESFKKNIPMAQMARMKTKKRHFNSRYHISIDNSSKSFQRCVFTFFFHGKRMNRIWSGTQMMFNQNWYLWTVCKPKRTLNACRSGKIPSWQVHDAFCLSFSFGFVQNPIISQQPM